jgi:hypothetical protein
MRLFSPKVACLFCASTLDMFDSPRGRSIVLSYDNRGDAAARSLGSFQRYHQ